MVGSFFAKKYLLQKAVTANSAVKIEGENGAYYAGSVRSMCKLYSEELILRLSISQYIQIRRSFLPQILPCQLSDPSAILNIEARNTASHAAVTCPNASRRMHTAADVHAVIFTMPQLCLVDDRPRCMFSLCMHPAISMPV